MPISVTINSLPAIALGSNPTICRGTTTTNLTYTVTSGSPDEYSVDFNAAANLAGFADIAYTGLPVTPIVLSIPGTVSAGTYQAILTIRNSITGCTQDSPISVIVNPTPSITLGASPTICSGTLLSSINYIATSASPNEYAVDYDGIAEAVGFTDVSYTTLPASPISLPVPPAVSGALYNASVLVRNTITGCVSGSAAASILVNSIPTITITPTAIACEGALTADLIYSAVSGSPNQYSIDYDLTAESFGFSDVSNDPFPANPVTLVIPIGTPADIYNATLLLTNNTTGCLSAVTSVSVVVNTIPAINIGSNPTICQGVLATNLTYTPIIGNPDQYSIDYDGIAEGQGFSDVVYTNLSGGTIALTIPGGALAGTYNASLTYRNVGTGCVASSIPISVSLIASPSITLGISPSVCAGTTVANISYSAVSNGADQYAIDYDATAEAVGFIDVVYTSLPVNPIALVVPVTAGAIAYNANLLVRNSVVGCVSATQGIAITVNPLPTIALDASPSVCYGVTSANLFFSSTSGSPDKYSIDYDASSNTSGFSDVVDAPIPISPISMVVPGATSVGVYDGNLTVKNTLTGCISSVLPVSVRINSIPSITLGSNPSICEGITSVSLPYLSASSSPNEYSIDYGSAAELQGFADVLFSSLSASSITLVAPFAALANTYSASMVVRNNITGCVSGASSLSITINPTPGVALGVNPTICAGTTIANVPYISTSGGSNEYAVNYDATAELAGFTDVSYSTLPVSPIPLTVLGGVSAATYNAALSVRNTITGCVGINNPIELVVNPIPSITLGSNPTVCEGIISANLSYNAISGGSDEYSIDYDLTANNAGFVDVVNTALSGNSITLVVPNGAAPSAYNAALVVRNSVTGCISGSFPFSVVISPLPTITLGASPQVCKGVKVADLSYSATSSTPNQYSVDYNPAAEAAGFADVTLSVLPVSTISLNVPGSASPSTYNALLTVKNSATGCVSLFNNLSVTVNAVPTMALGASPSVCQGVISSNLTYTASASPNQYSIDYSTAANTAGFTDITNSTLPISPLPINIPVAAAPGTYTATLLVTNTLTACASSSNSLSVTINRIPSITLGANPTVCYGTVISSLVYNSTSGSPNQYNIDYGAAANAAGFIDIVNGPLPLSPITLVGSPTASAGTYTASLTVRNSATGCSSNSNAISVVVRALDNASFAYSSGTYCKSGSNPIATINGLTGGTFSGSAGLVFVSASTGRINLTTSSIATHTVTYTTNGQCPNSSNLPITIINSPDPSFTYSGPYCTGAATNPSPTFIGGASAGVFTALPSGLVFVSSATGVIDLSASTSGTYTVTNTIACSGSSFTHTVVVTINHTPGLNSSLAPGAICSGDNFNYTPTSTIGGAAFSWNRATIPGISESGIGGNGSISEVLTNTTSSPITVTYAYVTAANGCSNVGENVNVVVNPIPKLSSTLSPPALCSGNTFNYTPISATSGAVFTWTRNTIAGIDQLGRSGLGVISELLTNSTSLPINVVYTFTSFANGALVQVKM